MTRSRYDSLNARSSPRRWWAAGTTLFWVAIVTVLVWLYADMEFTKDGKVTVAIRLSTEKSPDLVLLSRPSADPETRIISEIKAKIVFELRGNRRKLDAFISKHNNAAIQYEISQALGPGDNQQLPAAKIVSKDLKDDMEKMGLSIHSARPAAIEKIHIDQRIRRTLPVKLDYMGAELVEEPKLSLGVWARRAQWKKIDQALAGSARKAELLTVKKDLKTVEKGKRVPIKADIIPAIEGVSVQPEQATVTVSIEIREFTDTKTIQVTVRFVIPYTWLEDGSWDRYKLTREIRETTWVKKIEVTGAREDLARLKPEDVDAYVVLKEDDRKEVESWLTRTVLFRFPPNLRIKLVGTPHEVKFKLEPRKAGTVPGPRPP